MAGEKCSWIEDATTPVPLGHTGCAPAGSAPTGGRCTYGAAGATGYDNCVTGDVCNDGVCKVICDQDGGAPACGTGFTCTIYDGLFGPMGQSVAAGVCDDRCDPLADNDIRGSGSRGSGCATGQGCYGYPSISQPSSYACMPELNSSLVHRSACTTSDHCENAAGFLVNGCAQGYVPLLDDATGSMQLDCIAMCAPGNTYLGNRGAQAPAGVSPHTCSTTDARGTFDPATVTNNGDHCAFSWIFEVNYTTDVFMRSRTSDTLGFCIDHSNYKYDSNDDGMIDDTDAAWPLCAELAPVGSGAVPGGADFGCVDSMTGGFLARKPRVHSLRLPYAR